MITSFSLPAISLRPYVDRYWCWQTEQQHIANLPRLFPGTGSEIWFHLGTTPVQTDSSGNTNALPQTHILAPRNKPLQLQSQGPARLIAIRFRCQGLLSLLGIPVTELCDQLIDLTQLLPPQLMLNTEQLHEAQHWQQQTQLLDQWLLNLIQRQQQVRRYGNIVEHLYYQHKHYGLAPSLETIATTQGCSSRTLQRLFRQYTGVNSRSFQRLCRFQQTIRQLLFNQQPGYLETALNQGYYDQAHFVNDFKVMTAQTPQQFLQAENLSNHFYLTSIRSKTEVSALEEKYSWDNRRGIAS